MGIKDFFAHLDYGRQRSPSHNPSLSPNPSASPAFSAGEAIGYQVSSPPPQEKGPPPAASPPSQPAYLAPMVLQDSYPPRDGRVQQAPYPVPEQWSYQHLGGESDRFHHTQIRDGANDPLIQSVGNLECAGGDLTMRPKLFGGAKFYYQEGSHNNNFQDVSGGIFNMTWSRSSAS